MRRDSEFDPQDFLPYLLNQAAEALSREFQGHYRGPYGMLRTEWRVLFHLGCYGDMTAKEICGRARLHKTKVSRAVAALQAKRFLTRRELEQDRRHAVLLLTAKGQSVFAELSRAAHEFDSEVRAAMTPGEAEILHRCLVRIAGFEATQRTG